LDSRRRSRAWRRGAGRPPSTAATRTATTQRLTTRWAIQQVLIMKFLSRGSKYLVVEKLDTQRLGVGVAGGEKGGVEGPRVDGGLRQLVLPYSSSSSALTEILLRFHECFPAPMISPRTRISEKRRCISPPLRSGPECVIMMARRWYLPADTRVSGAYGCTVRAICQPRRLNEAAVPRLNMAANTCSSKKSQTGRRSRSIIPISSCAIIRISSVDARESQSVVSAASLMSRDSSP
jgi:hypothetical protein